MPRRETPSEAWIAEAHPGWSQMLHALKEFPSAQVNEQTRPALRAVLEHSCAARKEPIPRGVGRLEIYLRAAILEAVVLAIRDLRDGRVSQAVVGCLLEHYKPATVQGALAWFCTGWRLRQPCQDPGCAEDCLGWELVNPDLLEQEAKQRILPPQPAP